MGAPQWKQRGQSRTQHIESCFETKVETKNDKHDAERGEEEGGGGVRGGVGSS